MKENICRGTLLRWLEQEIEHAMSDIHACQSYGHDALVIEHKAEKDTLARVHEHISELYE